jgi:hypothetical protein
LDNYFDVGQLLEDSETKQQAITKVSELEEQLGAVSSQEILTKNKKKTLFDRRMKEFTN